MTDEIDVENDVPDPVDIEVGPMLALDVDTASISALDVSSRAATSTEVLLSSTSAVSVEPSSAARIEIDADPIDDDELELLADVILGLSNSEKDRLYSKAFGEKPGKAPIEVWSAGEKNLDGSGNSISWVITGTKQEIARGIVMAPLWRNRGELQIKATGNFTNTSGVAFYARFRIETMPWPNSTFPEPWTVAATFDASPLNDGPGIGSLSMDASLAAAGHSGSTFNKATTVFFWFPVAPNGLGQVFGVGFGGDVAIDTSRHIAIRITVQGMTMVADQALTMTSSNANLFNYEMPEGGN